MVIKMRICVFGAASNDIDNKYIEESQSLCRRLAEMGHSLIFGGGGKGLMGAAARGFKEGNGNIIGVIPHFFKELDIEALYEKCDKTIYTDTMRERKAEMEKAADAFIVLPGGIGTFEEFFEVLTLKQLGRHSKPIIVYNIDGYYDSMNKMMDYSVKEKFIYQSCKELYASVSDKNDIISCLTELKAENPAAVKEVKNG